MKKTAFVIFLLTIIFMCSSCTRISENSADEIRLNKWSLTTEYGNKVVLKFSGDKGIFKVKSSDKKACVTLKGLCAIDSDKIAIYNEADKENYIFTYRLKGNKLKLKYMGGKIILIRKNKENPSA